MTIDKLIVVVDVQNEFLNWQPDDIKNTLPSRIIDYLNKEAIHTGDKTVVFFTRDSHSKKDYNDCFESKKYPIHCEFGSKEWELAEELKNFEKEYNTITWIANKKTYGEYDMFSYFKTKYRWNPKKIIVFGLTTNICVLANMITLNTLFPTAEISTIESLTYGTSDEAKKNALEIMQGFGFNVIK